VPALGALALGGCGGGETPVRDEGPQLGAVPEPVAESEGGDAELLNSALGAEHFAIAAYTAAMPLLEGLSRDGARRFLAQERQHAARLRELIAGLGASAEEPLPSYDFDPPANEAETVRLLQHVERRTIVVYGGVVPRLADPMLRATAASIATTEAEHLAALSLRLGRWPARTPFVTGAA
jgi:rubrerythrin